MGEADYQIETWRQDFPTSDHKDTETIYLRTVESLTLDAVFNDLKAVSRPILRDQPYLRYKLLELMRKIQGAELGRAMIVKLKAGGIITPHADTGDYPEYYNRYHLPLISPEGCMFTVGDTTMNMREGLLYLIDNQQVHSVHNDSDTDRIHLIVDIKPI